MKKLVIHNKKFKLFIPSDQIISSVEKLAEQIKNDYAEQETPVFVSILNGSFMFTSTLMQSMDTPCELTFVKIASYQGLQSCGEVKNLIGLNSSLKGRNVIILEDIVETGKSIENVIKILEEQKVKSIEVATLFFKPNIYKRDYPIKYVANNIGDEFIVGFGLDYNQLGRNYKDVYVIDND